MKKLSLLLLLPFFLFSCSSDDSEKVEPEPTQDYTSVVVVNNNDYDIIAISIAYLEDGLYKLIGQTISIDKGKTSDEFKVDSNISEIYIFYVKITFPSYVRLKPSFTLKENSKNTFRACLNFIQQ